MNKKVIVGAVVAAVVVVVGIYFLRLQQQAAQWKEAKEIVEESFSKDNNVSKTHFVSIVDAPLDKVQAGLWDVEDSASMVDNIKYSKLVSQQGNTKTVEIRLTALNLPLQYYTMQFTLDPAAHVVSFKTTESQLQDLEGKYRLEASPDGKRTRVVYDATARDKVAIPFPQSVLESANRETFVNTMRGVKKYADTH
jgi:hypothetical protein